MEKSPETKDPTPDVGDEKQVKRKKSRAQRLREQNDEELRAVLSQPVGRAVIWRILQDCGIYQSSLSSEALQMAAREGRRNLGLWLMGEVHSADAQAYALMQGEAVAKEKEYG